jgi:hypothetical protein
MKTLVIVCTHRTSFSMIHSYVSQYDTRTTKVTHLKSREIVFQSVSRTNTVNTNGPFPLYGLITLLPFPSKCVAKKINWSKAAGEMWSSDRHL